MPVGQPPGDRTGDEKRGGHRQQVDAGPQWRLVVVVAVQRQPDALQPDDQHELQAATCGGADERSDVAGGELTDAKERELEHRIADTQLHEHERDKQTDTAHQQREHRR